MGIKDIDQLIPDAQPIEDPDDEDSVEPEPSDNDSED